MLEADVKRRIVKDMHAGKGYARRIEDQFAVGTYDMIIIPFGLPVFMAEIKLIRDHMFGPTPRQQIELARIHDVAGDAGHVIPVMIGYKEGNYYFHRPIPRIHRSDCFSVTTTDIPFHKQIVLYYYSLRGNK